MRRLWMSLLLVPVMVVAVASAAWASPAAPAGRSAPAGRTAPAAQAARPAAARDEGRRGQGAAAAAGRAEVLPGLDRRQVRHQHARGRVGVLRGAGADAARLRERRDEAGAGPPAGAQGAGQARRRQPDRDQPVPRGPRPVPQQQGPADQPRVERRPLLLLLPGGGCGYAVTPTGNFRTVVFMRGWVHVPLGEMYNPVFFIGTAFAIHGDTDVPLAPVSHGCVRIPMDIAAFFHKLVKDPGRAGLHPLGARQVAASAGRDQRGLRPVAPVRGRGSGPASGTARCSRRRWRARRRSRWRAATPPVFTFSPKTVTP